MLNAKEKIVSSALMVTSFFGAASKSVAQESLDKPAATASDLQERAMSSHPDFKAQRDFWIKQGEELGKVKLALELVEKNISKIDLQLKEVKDSSIKQEWQNEISPVFNKNISLVRKGLLQDSPDTESLFQLLDTTMLMVGKWGERLSTKQINSVKLGEPILPGEGSNPILLGVYDPIGWEMYSMVRPEAQKMIGIAKNFMAKNMEKLASQYDSNKTAGENIRDIGMGEARQTNEFSKGYRAGNAQGAKTGFENGYIKGKKEGYAQGVKDTEAKAKKSNN